MSQILALLYSSDGWVATRLSGWRLAPWLLRWMRLASLAGNGWLWVAAATTMPWLVRERALVLVELALAILASNVAIVILKRRFRRARPAPERPQPPLCLRPSKAMSFDEFSFPSGHTVNAFALAVLLTAFFPPWALAWFTIAVNIGVARILLRFHHATDVVAGAAIGALIAAFIHLALAS